MNLFDQAEIEGRYVDRVSQAGVKTRMYIVHVPGRKYTIQEIADNAVGKESVGVITWEYFNTSDVIRGEVPSPYRLYSATASRVIL